MNINDDNNGSTNNGGKSRFLERLKKIQYFRRRKRKSNNETLKEKENVKYDNRVFLKPFLIVSSFVVGSVKTENKKQNNIKTVSEEKYNDYTSFSKNQYNKNNKFKDTSLAANQNIINRQYEDIKININNNGKSLDSNIKIQELQIDIINLIKKRLVKNINELEMLQSELYILKEVTGEDVYLTDCTEKIKLLSKVKNLKEKYDYLKNNIDFDYLLEIADDSLVDKIIELKDMCSSDDIRCTVQNYKILEEYKYLYLKIDKLEEDAIKYNDYKKNKEDELKSRDIDFEKLKNDVYNKDFEQKRYDNFINEQEMFLKDLNEKIANIDSKEVVNYKIKGFNQLVGNSFKYLGLLLASPFKGLFPGIATQTVATRNVIHNLYNNLEIEEERKMVYEAIDFSSSINTAINDLDKTLNLVNATLEDISNLKNKYKIEFAKYEFSFSSYSEIIKKINKMENAVLNNKVKIELMRKKMYEKEKENSEKMKRVKKLNSSME